MTDPAPAKTSRFRRFARKLGLSLLSLALALAFAEVVVRALDLGPPPEPYSTGKIHRKSAAPLLPYEPIPGSKRTQHLQKTRGSEPVLAVARINQFGYRGPAFPPEKPDSVFRIVCIGDSFTFGAGVNDEGTWPAQLQRSLDRRRGEGKYEVLNFGIEGTNTVQEKAHLEAHALAFAPDLVLLGYYVNDAESKAVEHAKKSGFENKLVFYTRRENDTWVTDLRRWSVLLDTAANSVYRRIVIGRYAERQENYYTEENPGWKKVRRALTEMRDLLHEKGTRFALVLYPQLVRKGDGLGSDQPYGVVKDFCRESSIRAFDLGPTFVDQPLESLWVHPYDQHPTAAANQRAGVAVVEWLERSGLLE